MRHGQTWMGITNNRCKNSACGSSYVRPVHEGVVILIVSYGAADNSLQNNCSHTKTQNSLESLQPMVGLSQRVNM